MTACEMLSHNHGTEPTSIARTTSHRWCGTCRNWFEPLTEDQRDSLIDAAVSERITADEQAADAIWAAHEEAME